MAALSSVITGLNADASPDTAADYLLSYDASASTTKKVLMSVLLALASGSGIPVDGWVAAEAWTYVSADGPTGVFSAAADVTGKYQAGMRVKYTQTTVKYGIITAVGAFSGGVTNITVYGGTDYTTANAAITLPYYSTCKAPFGFNVSPAKWTQQASDTSLANQATPSINTWYNLATLSLSIPIGVWTVSYSVSPLTVDTTSQTWQIKTTLSTANNSESDNDFTTISDIGGDIRIGTSVYKEKVLSLAAKTSYFLNTETLNSGLDNMYNRGDVAKTIIRAVCALL